MTEAITTLDAIITANATGLLAAAFVISLALSIAARLGRR